MPIVAVTFVRSLPVRRLTSALPPPLPAAGAEPKRRLKERTHPDPADVLTEVHGPFTTEVSPRVPSRSRVTTLESLRGSVYRSVSRAITTGSAPTRCGRHDRQ